MTLDIGLGLLIVPFDKCLPLMTWYYLLFYCAGQQYHTNFIYRNKHLFQVSTLLHLRLVDHLQQAPFTSTRILKVWFFYQGEG